MIIRIIETALRIGERLAERRDLREQAERLRVERDRAMERAIRAELDLEVERALDLERRNRSDRS